MESTRNMKLSEYNLYSNSSDNILIFNFISGKFGLISKGRFENDDFNWFQLQKFGFAVPSEWDESFLANKHLSKELHGNELYLTLLASENCNFRCEYCFDYFNGENINDETIRNIEIFVRKNIRKYSGLNVSWFGGEPLLAKGAIEQLSDKLISICKAASRSYIASITTNGYLLDIDTFRSLLMRRVFSYEITLDGFEETHDKNRPHKNGKGSFFKIVENLRIIRDNVKSRMFNVIIRTNITKSMLCEFKEFAEFLKKEFGEDGRFTFRMSLVHDWGGERIGAMREELLYSMKSIYKELIDNNICLSPEAMIAELNERTCVYARDNVYTITPNGGVITCPQINKNHLGKLENGNMELNQYEFSKWYSLESSRIKECKECGQFFLCCGKMCPANLKAIVDNNLHIESLNCKIKAEEIKSLLEYIYLAKKQIFIQL